MDVLTTPCTYYTYATHGQHLFSTNKKPLLYWYPCTLRHAIPALEPTPPFSRFPLHMCFLSVCPPSPGVPPQIPLRTPPPSPPHPSAPILPCLLHNNHTSSQIGMSQNLSSSQTAGKPRPFPPPIPPPPPPPPQSAVQQSFVWAI